MTAQTQFYAGRIFIGGIPFPVYPDTTQLSVPRNYVAPPIVGNLWRLNYNQGLRLPVVTCSFVVRDVANEALSASKLLSYFFARSADAAHDTSIILGGAATNGSGLLGEGVVFWDGRTGFQITQAKADMFTLGSSQGDDIRFTARFCGAGLKYIIADEEAGTGQEGTYINASAIIGTDLQQLSGTPLNFTNKQLLRFNDLSFTTTAGAAINGVCSFNLTFTNNHTPDPGLNGTNFPNAMNAGMQDCNLQVTAQAADSYAGIDNDNQFATYGSGRPAPFIINVNGPKTGDLCSFSVNNPIDNTEDDRRITAPRVMRVHSYIGLGVDGSTTGPLTMASTF